MEKPNDGRYLVQRRGSLEFAEPSLSPEQGEHRPVIINWPDKNVFPRLHLSQKKLPFFLHKSKLNPPKANPIVNLPVNPVT